MSASATVLCLAALLVLLVAERRGSRRLRYGAKPVASVAFVAVALSRALGAPLHPGEEYLLAGVVLGAVGDGLLMFDAKAAFLGGLVAFLTGHAAYVVAFAHAAPPALWFGFPALLVVAWAGFVVRSLWSGLGDMRVPVIIYVATICVMVTAGIAVYRTGARDGALVALGAVLFALSDVAVAKDKFVADTFANKAWGLPLYYVAQLLLAWTVGT